MSTNGLNRGERSPLVSTILNDTNATNGDNKEDDAALVDSFFLPGGLFSDETNDHHGRESDIGESKHYTAIDSISRAVTMRSPSSHLSKNPWEPTTSNTKIAVQSVNFSDGSVQIDSSCARPLHSPLSSKTSNDEFEVHMESGNMGSKFTNNISHLNLSSPHRTIEGGKATERTMNEASSFLHIEGAGHTSTNTNQESILHGIMTNRAKESSTFIRPPPGFRSGSTIFPSVNVTGNNTELIEEQHQGVPISNGATNSIGFLATNSTGAGTGNKYFLRSSNDPMGPINNQKRLTGTNKAGGFFNVSSNRPNRSVNYTHTGFQQGSSMPSKNATVMHPGISKSDYIPSRVDNDKYEKELNNHYPMKELRGSPSSIVTPDLERETIGAPEVHAFPLLDASKGNRGVPNGPIENDDDADAEIEEDDSEDNSIPSSICVSMGHETSSSSLSTYSEVDNNSEFSSHASGNHHQRIDDDGLKEEGVGYDTDQAHVSHILGAMESVLCNRSTVEINENRDGDRSKSSGLSENSKRARRRPPSLKEESNRSGKDPNKLTFSVERMTSFFRDVLECCNASIDHGASAMRTSLLYAEVSKRREQFTLRIKKVSRDFRIFASWVVDVEEAFGVSLRRLTRTLLKFSMRIMAILTMISLFLFQVLKFGFIEATEEFDAVTSCYVALYLLPRACVALMSYVNLPHWTPHTATWLAIFALCRPAEAGTLRDASDLSIPWFATKSVGARSSEEETRIAVSSAQAAGKAPSSSPAIDAASDPSPTTTRGQQQQQLREEQYHRHDERVCFLLLNMLKTALPVLFLLEGFSSEFGTMTCGTSTDRLTKAFVLSVLRKSVLTSPIFWISWALQVLLAAHFSPGILLDFFVLLTGLSSIRLIRYIDFRQAREKGGHDRSKTQ